MINHILLEVYCERADDRSIQCPLDVCAPQYACVQNKCPCLVFTSSENALCYVNEKSETDIIISLGGEMVPENVEEDMALPLWKEISRKKALEAYEEYMKQIQGSIRAEDVV